MYVTDDMSLQVAATYSFVLLLFCLAMIIAQWRIFTKAGEDGWKSLIPFYNSYCFFEIIAGNGWLFLISFIPGIGAFILWILSAIKLSAAFRRGTAFTFGLLFFSPIFMMILAFGPSQYDGPAR